MNINEAKQLNVNYKYVNLMSKIRSIEDEIVTAIKNQRTCIEILNEKKEFVDDIMTHFENQGFTCDYNDGVRQHKRLLDAWKWNYPIITTLTISGWAND